jgi:hypothetical protein
MNGGYVRRRGLVGPIILISLGVLFLLNNLGLLQWTVWEVAWRLWPIALIGLGLDLMIGRRSLVGSIVVVVLMVLAFVGGVYWMNVQAQTGQPFRQQEFTQPLQGATSADVDVHFGVGRLNIGALQESQDLINGSLALDPGELPVQSFQIEGSKAVFSLRSEGISTGWFLGQSYRSKVWDLKLNPNIPIYLTVNGGASQTQMDLSGMKLSGLEYTLGVGQGQVILPDQGNFDAVVHGGVGQFTIIVPAGLEARVEMSGWLGSTNFRGSYQRNGNTITTSGFQNAANWVDMKVEGGIGQITIIFQ